MVHPPFSKYIPTFQQNNSWKWFLYPVSFDKIGQHVSELAIEQKAMF